MQWNNGSNYTLKGKEKINLVKFEKSTEMSEYFLVAEQLYKQVRIFVCLSVDKNWATVRSL